MSLLIRTVLVLLACCASAAGATESSESSVSAPLVNVEDSVLQDSSSEDAHDITLLSQSTHSQEYSSLSARWWQWAFGSENAVIFDRTGEQCALGQPESDVWFLAGQMMMRRTVGDVENVDSPGVSRLCTIPSGRRLFFPLLNSYNGCLYPQESVDDLRQQLDSMSPLGNAGISISLGGSVAGFKFSELLAKASGEPSLLAQRTKSEVFSIGSKGLAYFESQRRLHRAGVSNAHDADSPHGGYACPDVFVGDGYYVLLAPLPPGRHRLVIDSSTRVKDSVARVHVTYDLTVLE